jgi:hypothetical protein
VQRLQAFLGPDRFSVTLQRRKDDEMTATDIGRQLSEDRRREIFLALVQTQDSGTPVAESREAVARRFDLTARQVRDIEREGLDGDWPPL